MGELYAQTPNDTARTLPAIRLTGKKNTWIMPQAFPAQKLGREDIRESAALTVADPARLFPGTMVKDYGGMGGLKTISVRSLGAHHSAVMYDGLMVSDMQGGQVDLGKLSVTNVESIGLYQAQPPDLLLPARAFASASVLSIQTMGTDHANMPGTRIQTGFRAGSWGFVNPMFAISGKPGKKYVHALQAEYARADGAYPFTAYDQTADKLKRQNSDIQNHRIEYDASVQTGDSGRLRVKLYHYYSNRGLPGSVIFFNPFSRQRLTDNDQFIQSSWRKQIRKTALLVSAKYSQTYKKYIDPDFLNAQGKLENRFREREFYVSGALRKEAAQNLRLSLSSDFFHTRLTRSGAFLGDTANPIRNSSMTHLGLQWLPGRLQVQGGLLGTYISDKIGRGRAAKDIFRVTPTVGLMYRHTDTSAWTFRLFYKTVFRAPTFNDLYYTFVGNASLRPETVQQINAGLAWQGRQNGTWSDLVFSMDLYGNRVTDKIMAVPRQNLFQWSMMNVGRVQVLGIDFAADVRWKPLGSWAVRQRLAYGYQRATDMTQPGSASYKNQLPYTPEHSGSISTSIRHRWLTVSHQALFSSLRYRPGDQVAENRLEGWLIQDVRISMQKVVAKSLHEVFVECSNAFDTEYEIIRFYPMPGRQVRFGYTFTLDTKQSTTNHKP